MLIARGWGAGGNISGDRVSVQRMSKFWSWMVVWRHNSVVVPNAAEVLRLKMVRILCYIYFTKILKKLSTPSMLT